MAVNGHKPLVYTTTSSNHDILIYEFANPEERDEQMWEIYGSPAADKIMKPLFANYHLAGQEATAAYQAGRYNLTADVAYEYKGKPSDQVAPTELKIQHLHGSSAKQFDWISSQQPTLNINLESIRNNYEPIGNAFKVTVTVNGKVESTDFVFDFDHGEQPNGNEAK